MVDITAHSAAQKKKTRRPIEKVRGLDLLEVTGSGTAVYKIDPEKESNRA